MFCFQASFGAKAATAFAPNLAKLIKDDDKRRALVAAGRLAKSAASEPAPVPAETKVAAEPPAPPAGGLQTTQEKLNHQESEDLAFKLAGHISDEETGGQESGEDDEESGEEETGEEESGEEESEEEEAGERHPAVDTLVDMGFTAKVAQKALEHTDFDVEAALEWALTSAALAEPETPPEEVEEEKRADCRGWLMKVWRCTLNVVVARLRLLVWLVTERPVRL